MWKTLQNGQTRAGQMMAFALFVGTALASTACAQSGPASEAPATGSGKGSCTPSDEQRTAVDAYKVKSFGDYVPEGVQKTKTVAQFADCTTGWHTPRGLTGPAKPFAALRTDYETSLPMTSAELSATFGTKAVTAGWQPNGGWDDSQGDGSAYANYCQKIAGNWTALSIYRGPAVDKTMHIEVIIEGYPGAVVCPGQPTGG